MIDSTSFIRNAKEVYKAHQKVDNQIVARDVLKMYVPLRFESRDFLVLEDEISVLGITGWVYQDKYFALSKIPGFYRTEPSLINNVTIDNEEYVEFTYQPGDLVVANIAVVKIDNLMYRIFDELIAKGKLPWYMNYNDLLTLYEYSEYHAGVKLGSTRAPMEIVGATIARSPHDPKTFYRQWLTSKEQVFTEPPVNIPLRAVSYGATNVIAKLLGSHFNENLTSALVSPGDRVEDVERLLRM